MSVDDVEPRRAEAVAQRARRQRVGERPGRKLEQLDLDVADPPQCGDLVADEHAARRTFA